MKRNTINSVSNDIKITLVFLTSQAILRRDLTQRHCGQLREHCCQAMSNLLSANCDVGLGHAIFMGYDVDWGVRLAFTDVRCDLHI